MAKIDSRCPWVKATDGVNVKVMKVEYSPAKFTQGRVGIYIFASHRKIPVYCFPFQMLTPDSVDDFATSPELVSMLQGGFFDPKNGAGPFTFKLGDAKVEGIGLPGNEHVLYAVTFDIKVLP